MQNSSAVIAGSTWPDDEDILRDVYKAGGFGEKKLVIAPHENNEGHLKNLADQFPDALFFSSLKEDTEGLLDKKVLIIDNVGMLSRLYKYASVAYIGGGFTKDGIHNILEAAVWGKPVVFGPNYQKYREAKELIEAGGGFSVKNADELKQLASKLMTNEQYRQAVGEKAKNYVFSNTGATEKILQEIQAKRLLTN
ncbi:MAG: hypothetical protein EON98_11975 [Chitinophagaceae bacterium]|nr:MAG: hypothetical protein EON98_11975 [Chitinophagaceae bacterium]